MVDRTGESTPHRPWKQADINMLRDRLGAGDTPADVSQSLDRSLENVMLMMSRLRLR